MSLTERSTALPRDIDPLLKDLNDRKQNFRRNVVSLAAELKEARSRLASQEQSFARETLTRQEAETKAQALEDEIYRLQKQLEEQNQELVCSASTTEKYMKEMDDLKSQLLKTQAIAESSAASAESAQLQCVTLLKELDEKNQSLKNHEDRVHQLADQLDGLQKDLQERESSQKQLKDEVLKIERDIMEAVTKAGVRKDCELRKILEEVSPKNIDKINKILVVKDEEIARLRDEVRIVSAQWKMKTEEMESQLEKQRRSDQDLKKRVLKLEFCLQDARAQMRKLQRSGERREKMLKELREQLAAAKEQNQEGSSSSSGGDNHNFWESQGFKLVVSMSMLILVVFSKR